MSLESIRLRERDRWMPETCVIERFTSVPDQWGGTEDTWAPVATVPARISQAGHTPQEQVIADQVQATTLVTIVVPAGTDVQAQDRMVVRGRPYEVVAPIVGSMQANQRVVCRGD